MAKQNKTYILAEIAASHEGKEKIAESIIKNAALAKADGILFQIIDLKSYIVPKDEDYKDIKSFYLNQKIWERLIKKANSFELDVWANIYDLESAKFCKDKDIKGFKLHSANLENEELIKEVVKFKKEMLLSVGGLEKSEIEKTLKLIYSINKKAKIYLMYGLQNCPTNPAGVNLNFIKNLSEELKLPFGYQDHSEPTSPASTYLPVLFISQGASIIEKHITYDRNLKGQDYWTALNPDEFSEFVKDIGTADLILSKNPKEVSPEEFQYKDYKSIIKVVAKKEIKKGTYFSEDNLAVMRAKRGEISGRYFKKLLGKESFFSYKKLEPIKRDELFKVGIFITARLKSTRLPQKAVRHILGKPMIVWMIEGLKRCGITLIVMMTSVNPQDDPLVEIAKKQKIKYFRGSEDDVLLRIRDCARYFNVDLVISATADDPLKEPIFIKKMVEKYYEKKYDFCEIEGLPNGCESYAVSKSALEKVCEVKNESDTEIWGNYFRNTGKFKCDVIKVEDPNIFRPQYRVTIDTKEDFELVEKIFSILSKKKDYFNVYDVCRLLDENPDLVKINAKVRQVKAPKIKIRK